LIKEPLDYEGFGSSFLITGAYLLYCRFLCI